MPLASTGMATAPDLIPGRRVRCAPFFSQQWRSRDESSSHIETERRGSRRQAREALTRSRSGSDPGPRLRRLPQRPGRSAGRLSVRPVPARTRLRGRRRSRGGRRRRRLAGVGSPRRDALALLLVRPLGAVHARQGGTLPGSPAGNRRYPRRLIRGVHDRPRSPKLRRRHSPHVRRPDRLLRP